MNGTTGRKAGSLGDLREQIGARRKAKIEQAREVIALLRGNLSQIDNHLAEAVAEGKQVNPRLVHECSRLQCQLETAIAGAVEAGVYGAIRL